MSCRLPSWVPRVMARTDFREQAFYQTHPFVALMMWMQVTAVMWDWFAGDWGGWFNAAVLVWIAWLERRRSMAFDRMWAWRTERWIKDGQ